MSLTPPSLHPGGDPFAPLAWIGRTGVPPELTAAVTRFDDSDDFLLHPGACDFHFFVVQLEQRGVCGLDLLRLIRRRSAAGVLALGAGVPGEWARALGAGADMLLPLDASDDDVCTAVAAVMRRCCQVPAQHLQPWTLCEQRAVLQAPDGTDIALSQTDLALLQCFAEASGGQVARAVLVRRLWGAEVGPMDNALHATVYRLRKRIEQAGQTMVPVHSVARVGYEFCAPLIRA